MTRRSNPIVPILTFGLFAAVAAVAAYAFFAANGSTGDGAGSSDGGAVVVPPPVRGTEDETALSPIPTGRITVEASSFLPPAGDLTYDPGNTLDADLQTAWNSASDGDGRGETLTYRFDEPIDLQAVRFVNGYAKDESVYDQNHRIRTLTIRTDGGDREISLLDTVNRQQVAADFGPTSAVVIEVTDVYIGSGFESGSPGDLALTEIEFLVSG